jgi:hypothetical protein
MPKFRSVVAGDRRMESSAGAVLRRRRAHTWTRLHRRLSCEEHPERARCNRDRTDPTPFTHATIVEVRVMNRVRRIMAGAGRGEGIT